MASVSARDRLVIRMYAEIENLMRAMARDIANPSCWQLAVDEVLGELTLKMVTVVYHYDDKPFSELKALVIKSLHNFKSDLRASVYDTYRSNEIGALDVDENEDRIPGETGIFLMSDFLDELPSEDSRLLVKEILEPSTITRRHMELTIIRKIATSDNGGWQMDITPLLMERALGWNRCRLKQAWEDVSNVLAEHVSSPV